MPILEIVKEGGQRFRSQVLGDRMTIGRSRTCGLAIRDASVSKSHAVIDRRPDGSYFLSDLGSTNGIRINGRQVPGEALQDGTSFVIGRYTLTFRPDKTPPAGGGAAGVAGAAGAEGKDAPPPLTQMILGSLDDRPGHADPGDDTLTDGTRVSGAGGLTVRLGPPSAAPRPADMKPGTPPAATSPPPAPASTSAPSNGGATSPGPITTSAPVHAPATAPAAAAAPGSAMVVQITTSLPCTEIVAPGGAASSTSDSKPGARAVATAAPAATGASAGASLLPSPATTVMASVAAAVATPAHAPSAPDSRVADAPRRPGSGPHTPTHGSPRLARAAAARTAGHSTGGSDSAVAAVAAPPARRTEHAPDASPSDPGAAAPAKPPSSGAHTPHAGSPRLSRAAARAAVAPSAASAKAPPSAMRLVLFGLGAGMLLMGVVVAAVLSTMRAKGPVAEHAAGKAAASAEPPTAGYTDAPLSAPAAASTNPTTAPPSTQPAGASTVPAAAAAVPVANAAPQAVPPPVAAPAAAAVPASKPADDVHTIRLRSGQVLKAKILKRTAAALEVVDMANGADGSPATHAIEDVEKIDAERVTPDWKAIFNERLAALGESPEAAACVELAQWAEKHRLGPQRDQAYQLALKTEPDNALARAARGDVRVGGQWMSREEAKRQNLLDAQGNPVQTIEGRRAVRRFYVDLLGRSPSEDEFKAAAGATQDELVGKLVHSVEHFETWYEEQLFYFLLIDNFRPATENLTSIPERLANAEITVRDAIHEIVICQYFNHRNPGNDTYVTVILEQLLGMVVQDRKELLERGKKMYDGYANELFGKKGASQADFVDIVVEQEAFAESFLKRCHVARLGRPPSKEVLTASVARFVKDPASFPDIEKTWILSKGYVDAMSKLKLKDDPMFIRSLYMDLLGRRPSYQEFRSMRNALLAMSDSGPIRSVLAKVIVDSDKVKVPDKAGLDLVPWLEAQYGKYLCRRPTEDEVRIFQEVLSAKGTTTKTLLLAILTSQEYQYY
ncbi:MAG: FHA domain-containing protein [Planctomycetes bacterium]|nr:FHA domain-containing protein [Planctomycetota bacterium]